jgi:hypothetical protein
VQRQAVTARRSSALARAVSAGVFVALLTACTGRQADSELKRRVTFYCHDFTSRLERAVVEYRTLASALDHGQLTPEQRARIEILLELDAIGVTREVRRTKMHDLETRFMFCVGIRKLDEKRRNELYNRGGVLSQTLREQCFDANACTVTSHEAAVHTLEELASIARELHALPLVD